MTIEQFEAAYNIQSKINRVKEAIDEIDEVDKSGEPKRLIFYPVGDDFRERFRKDLKNELVNELIKLKNEFSKI